MKKISIYLILALVGIFTYSCDPTEDRSLIEDNFENAGTPISKEELLAALEVSQPLPNVEGVVEGDQYIVVNNKRKDIGGTWVLELANGTKTSKSDYDTIVSTENGILKLYYQGVSAGKIVKTDPILVTVTNVFDIYEQYLTGAENKADAAATKTWEFVANKVGDVCYMGAHGAWKYEVDIWASGIRWWAQKTADAVAGETMVFGYDSHTFKVYNADGTEKASGGFSFTHDEVEAGILGELTTTVPILGSRFDESGQASTGSNTYWIMELGNDNLVIYHTSKLTGGVDWSDSGWWAFYKAKN